jgi:hypothetical protein
VVKLGTFGVTALSRKLDDAPELARVTGTSVGRAKDTVATAKVVGDSGELSTAMQRGDLSLDQATEIARAESAAPGAAAELLPVAKEQSFHVLKDKARTAKLEAERDKDLFPASTPPAGSTAIATPSGWSTSISPSSLTSGPR